MPISTSSTEAPQSSNTRYFGDLEYLSQQFAAETFAMAEGWCQMAEDSGLARRWTNNEFLYAGVDPSRTASGNYTPESFQVVGDNGELLYASFNDARNLITHQLNMCVAQPPNMQAKAINDDSKSLVAAQTFEGVFEHYYSTFQSGRLMKCARLAVEYCLVSDIGYTLVEYDPYGGKATDTPAFEKDENGEPLMEPDEMGQMAPKQKLGLNGAPQFEFEGDLRFSTKSVWDVFWDAGVENEGDADWCLVRDQINKYELADRYQEQAQRIIGTAASSGKLNDWRRGIKRATKTNMIDVWKFYHRPTASMPKGRFAILLDSQMVLFDGPNPYDCLPVFSIKAAESFGSIIGYAPMNTLAPVQMAQNVVTSSQITNYAMFGVQNIAVKDTDQFDPVELTGGMNIWRYSDAPPAGIQLAKQAEGIGDYEERLGRKGELLSGINSVVRGDPEASLKSGKALGIVQAAAVQFMNALASSYAQYLKDIGNFMLQVFRKYFKRKRITQIVGEHDMKQSVEWDGDAFGPIDRVSCELVDPAMRTIGYRTDLAMFMAQNNLTATPQEFLTVLTTGQLKPMYRGGLSSLNLCHSENDEMQKSAELMQQQLDPLEQQIKQVQAAGGDPSILMQQLEMAKQTLAQQLMPPVLLTDDHDLHLAEHPQVTNNVATRRNGAVTALNLAHMKMHMDMKAQRDSEAAVTQAKTQALVAQQLAAMGIQMGPPAGEENQQKAQKKPPQNAA